jgi:exonuclease SbcD
MADSHLGFTAYSRVDYRGRNLREEQIYKGFDKAVDKIIQLRPDAVVHAGDVFHHVRPRIKPLYVFKRALEKLNEAGIPIIIISGNHDAPKGYAAISPFYINEGMEDVHIAHEYRYECFEVGDHFFHCIPFCLDPKDYMEEFRKIRYTGRDVLVMHGLIEALWNDRLRTVGEHELKDSFLKSDFSYIALGHYHGQAQVAKNAWYSGSIDYFSFGEAGDDKGFLHIDLEGGSVDSVPVTEKYMVDHPWIECDGLSSQEIMDELGSLFDEDDIKDKIVRVKLRDVSREAYRNIDPVWISRLSSAALYLKIMPEFVDVRTFGAEVGVDAGSLPDEFEKFLEDEVSGGRIPKAIEGDVVTYGKDMIQRIVSMRTSEVFDAPK